MTNKIKRLAQAFSLISALGSGSLTSCIEPPLHLPAEEVIVEVPTVITDMDVVWSVDVNWQADWHFGWDLTDISISGDIDYPTPSNYEVRRYYIGTEPGGEHKSD